MLLGRRWTEYTAKVSYGIWEISSLRDSFSGSMLDFPSNNFSVLPNAPKSYIPKKVTSSSFEKAASNDMVIVLNIHLGELQQFQHNFFSPVTRWSLHPSTSWHLTMLQRSLQNTRRALLRCHHEPNHLRVKCQ